MKIFVTGSAGFIGSNFVRHIFRERPQWHVVSYDLLTYAGNPDNLAEFAHDPRHTFVQGDIADQKKLEALFSQHRPDVVVNFAAETHVDRSIHDGAAAFIHTNVGGVHALLEAVRKGGVPRMVHVSTDEVYGALPLESGTPFTEETAFAPNSPYAASKAGGDLLGRSYVKTFGVPLVVTHAANNYGPWHFPEKLIPFFIMRAMQDQSLPLYGDGKYVRDWLHVDDHCAGILAAVERGVIGETYNIGADNERANIDVAKMILKLLGKPETLLTFVTDRPGHDRRYAISSEKIRNDLGWQPKYGAEQFEKGLQETIAWFEANQDWAKRAVERANGANHHITT
ncbi:dTDP-glucose 4,6-dehydratase [Patescibacteria group bacterium]|nr:dTDP-glucose 4,6-dehydratase [Patescibacteria group bacterium]